MFDLKSLGLNMGFIKQFGLKKALKMAKHFVETQACKHECNKFRATFDLKNTALEYLVWWPNKNWPEKYQGSDRCPPGTHLYIQDKQGAERFVGAIKGFLETMDDFPKNANIDMAILEYDENGETVFYAGISITEETVKDGEKITEVKKQTIKHVIK